MKAKFTQWITLSVLVTGWLTAPGGLSGCSTTQLVAPEPPAVMPPPYVQVPHPMGPDLGDLRAIMLQPDVPPRESLKDCDADFKKLRLVTQSEDERRQGARELVKRDPVAYHWCFYTKVLNLEDTIKTSNFIDEKQKLTLDTYQFLVPVARGFLAEFHDSRYLRWAITHYRKISEYVFFRRVELTAEGTSELVQVANPFGLWRDAAPEATVLEKYGIVKPSGEAAAGENIKTIFPSPDGETEQALAPPTSEPDRQPAGEALPAIEEPPTAPAPY